MNPLSCSDKDATCRDCLMSIYNILIDLLPKKTLPNLHQVFKRINLTVLTRKLFALSMQYVEKTKKCIEIFDFLEGI